MSRACRPDGSHCDDRDLANDHGTVVHREKVVSRALALMMAAGAMFFALAGVAAIATERRAPWWALLVPFVISLAFAAVGLLKPVLRTTVTDEEVYAEHGLREACVSMCAIESVKVVKSSRDQLLGAELIGPSVGESAVLIEWTYSDGSRKKTALPSANPTALAAAINEVRDARASRLSSVRIMVHERDEDGVPAEIAPAAIAAPAEG